MPVQDFIEKASGHVSIRLTDGSTHSGRFRTELLSSSAISAYFYGDAFDLSLPIHAVVSISPFEG